uniref:Uncharacterized protein n=1 Tax=Anopheles epiroticus TaxID=199890 RepID=A0A182P2Q3_9DIPT
MESNFVSVFKLDGVPILPPLINDEVRATVAIYRQKALEIEKRLQEKRKKMATKTVAGSQAIERGNGSKENALEVKNGAKSPTSEFTLEIQDVESVTITPTEVVDDADSMDFRNIADRSPGAVPLNTNSLPDDVLSEPLLQGDGETQSNREPQDWQSPTRTVTPTTEELLLPFPLVRSNTFNLEKPSIDLMNLKRVDHSTPMEKRPVGSSSITPKEHQTTCDQSNQDTSVRNTLAANENAPIAKTIASTIVSPSMAKQMNKLGDETKKPDTDPIKNRPKRRTVSRRVSHSSAGSGRVADRAFENVAQALTIHEQRMMELLKRQEEERLMLEESFRAKTQELVALCAKSLTVQDTPRGNDESRARQSAATAIVRSKTPELNTASSVSQLSLCDVSYDSCSDTDEAAYQTCQANGTSEENVANGEHTLTEDQLRHNNDSIATINSSLHATATTKLVGIDSNGNDDFSLLPQRMMELQRDRAATIINAYVRGYLTRRLFKTVEAERITSAIADIVCFLISLQTEGMQGYSKQAAAVLRRDAGKHIASCLDRLHEIFVNCTVRERMEMIRRDRALISKRSLLKVDQQNV